MIQRACFISVGVLLIFGAIIYWRKARAWAEMMSPRLIAHPWQRFWWPARWYTTESLSRKLRLGAVLLGLFGIGSIIVGLCVNLSDAATQII